MQKKLKFWPINIVFLLGGGLGLFLALDYYYPLQLTRYINTSPLIFDNKGELISIGLSKDQFWRIRTSLENVDPLFIKMLLSYEDKRFYHHPGIDPFAILRALFQWGRAGKVISGGSTITLQTVRLLEPRTRTFKNKIIECFKAFQLEFYFSKKQILEVYLSLAPFGSNIEGIETASLKYLGKKPKFLRAGEAAFFVVMPQLPNQLRPELYPERTKKFRDKVIERMEKTQILTSKQAFEAKQDQVPSKVFSFPRHALHLLNLCVTMNNKKANNEYSKNSTLPINSHQQTTIDKKLQIEVEKLLKSELTFLESNQTIAAIIIENKSNAILAYVANADFFDEKRFGQVNMIEHFRSPGSTLKPFIYGMGFDDGIIHPETIMLDKPTDFGDYSPSNFKDSFHGEVTVKQALQQSLNVPAVMILDKIKPGRFMAHLQNMGIKFAFKNNVTAASLPVALGAVGITLKDLASLYAALANQGKFYPLKLWKNDSFDIGTFDPISTDFSENSNGKSSEKSNKNLSEIKKDPTQLQLLSNASAWHISRILEEAPSPEGFVNRNVTEGPILAYKTGTSYGFRDAWAMGYTNEHTIGVWVGKPDGTPSFNQTGRINAGPILFKISRLLPNISGNNNKVNLPPTHHLLSLTQNQLPLNLKKYMYKSEISNHSNLRIQFPKEGMILAVSQTNQTQTNQTHNKPISLLLTGGKPPFYLFLYGTEFIGKFESRRIEWVSQTLGFIDLTILDSGGQSESINIELK